MFLSLLSTMKSEKGYKCAAEIAKPATYDDIKAGCMEVSKNTRVSRNSHKKYRHMHNKGTENRQ